MNKLKSKKLNLGCGKDIRDGWVNLDAYKNDGVDISHDLDVFPYPFEDNTFDEIYAVNILEHLLYPDKAIKEIWRIGKNNCKVFIAGPHFSYGGFWKDLTHRRAFSYGSFDNYSINWKTRSLVNFQNVSFVITRRNISFSRVYRALGIRYFANKFPGIYECFFANIFPGRVIFFWLKVVK